MDIFTAFAPTLKIDEPNKAALEKTPAPVNVRDEKSWEVAKEFEAAFIAQMLTYSGMAKALTSGGGEDVASFSQFYMESIAKDLTDKGGFGIAEKIYTHIEKKKESSDGDLGRL